MKTQTTILIITVALTGCPLPIKMTGDEASDAEDTTEDTSETDTSETDTTDTSESTDSTDSGVVDESTDSGDDLADESGDTMDVPVDMPMEEEWGCCVCIPEAQGPICVPPQSATELACDELGNWAGTPATWVPCAPDRIGLIVCELDCGP